MSNYPNAVLGFAVAFLLVATVVFLSGAHPPLYPGEPLQN